MGEGTLVPFGVDHRKASRHFGKIFPVVPDVLGFLEHQIPSAGPGVEQNALRPFAFPGGHVNAVVFRGAVLVAHAASHAEVFERAPPQLPIEIVLVVPAEAAVAEIAVDEHVVHPVGKHGAIEAGDFRRGDIGRIGQPFRLFAGGGIIFALPGQKIHELPRQLGALLHRLGRMDIAHPRRETGIEAKHAEKTGQQGGKKARRGALPPAARKNRGRTRGNGDSGGHHAARK